MTIEKMREEIEEFCDNAKCCECPLLHGKCGTALVTDEDVWTAYTLIYGKDEERKDEIDLLKKLLKTARADAVREFAERLLSGVVHFCDIERVVKEMTEGEK